MKYRVGRKQKRAVLNENGQEIGIFTTGNEQAAQDYCDYLNSEMRIYGAYYNPCTAESVDGLISLHRTKLGAEKALEAHKKNTIIYQDGFESVYQRWLVIEEKIED
jgi:hypothetical protein